MHRPSLSSASLVRALTRCRFRANTLLAAQQASSPPTSSPLATLPTSCTLKLPFRPSGEEDSRGFETASLILLFTINLASSSSCHSSTSQNFLLGVGVREIETTHSQHALASGTLGSPCLTSRSSRFATILRMVAGERKHARKFPLSSLPLTPPCLFLSGARAIFKRGQTLINYNKRVAARLAATRSVALRGCGSG
jgi:hypothetical protein